MIKNSAVFNELHRIVYAECTCTTRVKKMTLTLYYSYIVVIFVYLEPTKTTSYQMKYNYVVKTFST